MKDFIARADVYFNQSFFYITTMSTGMVAYIEPEVLPYYLQSDVANTELGCTVRLALNGSRHVSSDEFQKILRSGIINKIGEERNIWMMGQYGYKSKRALFRKMDNCSVSVSKEEMKVQPMHHDSLSNYSATKDKGPFPICLSVDATDEELGAALREGFARCTSSVK